MALARHGTALYLPFWGIEQARRTLYLRGEPDDVSVERAEAFTPAEREALDRMSRWEAYTATEDYETDSATLTASFGAAEWEIIAPQVLQALSS